MSKLNWGLIGGGEGSQIGPAHRYSAALDGLYAFTAGALDANPERGRAFAQRLGLAPDRAYGDWRDMLDSERRRPDRIDLVTIATPNSTHYEIAKAFLEAGIAVLCEKPMTMTVEEAEDIAATVERVRGLFAVNYGYTGYSLVRHMRAMVRRGDLGKVRLIKAEFAHGFHADAADADNPRVRWRYDPAQMGPSAQFADCGIHALHLASYVCGEQPSTPFRRFCFDDPESETRRRRDGQFPHGRRRGAAAVDEFGGDRAHAWPEHSGLRREGRPALGAGMAQSTLLDAA